jgi:hypothetical protein
VTETNINSPTDTPVDTETVTPTITVTGTESLVPGETVTPTYTRTPGAVPTAAVFRIDDVMIFPNPFIASGSQDANLHCFLTQDADKIKIKIYTMSYRAAREIEIPGSHAAGNVDAAFDRTGLKNLANGLYYFVAEGENAGGRARSAPGILVVLK